MRLIGPGFPWGTLAVNILGSFLMGVIVVVLGQLSANRFAPLLMTGMLGGFTTFSAFSLDAVTHVGTRRASATAVAYVLASVGVLSLAALVAGLVADAEPGMSGVQTLTVGPEDGDQRLDRWFRSMFPHVSQGQIEKMCRKGEIRVDGGRVKARDAGSRPGSRCASRRCPSPGAAARRRAGAEGVTDDDIRMIQDAVIWKDDHIIAINKPPGLPSQGGSRAGRPPCRRAGRGADASAAAKSRRLVHRLDKDTSGVLLLARRTAIAPPADRGVPRPRDAQDLLGRRRRRAEAAHGHDPLRAGQGGGHGRGGEGEKMRCIHPDEVARHAGRQARHDRLRGDREPGHARGLGGAGAGDRADPPAARPYGRDRASDRRRRQVRRHRGRRTWATAGARSWAARSAASCTCTPGSLRFRHPVTGAR